MNCRVRGPREAVARLILLSLLGILAQSKPGRYRLRLPPLDGSQPVPDREVYVVAGITTPVEIALVPRW